MSSTQMFVDILSLRAEDFPFTAELFRADTGKVLWSQEVTEPGPLRVPSFGDPAVRGRITFADGTVIEEG